MHVFLHTIQKLIRLPLSSFKLLQRFMMLLESADQAKGWPMKCFGRYLYTPSRGFAMASEGFS
jgi:hypothetical protein